MTCILSGCSVLSKDAGCGYVIAGTPCAHPQYRGEWAKAMLIKEGQELMGLLLNEFDCDWSDLVGEEVAERISEFLGG